MLSKRIIFSIIVKNEENQGNNIKVVMRYDEIFKLFLLLFSNVSCSVNMLNENHSDTINY